MESLHLDKAFTLSRIRDVQPGLLGAIEASTRDFSTWTPRQWVTRGVVAGIAGTAGFIRAGASPGPTSSSRWWPGRISSSAALPAPART